MQKLSELTAFSSLENKLPPPLANSINSHCPLTPSTTLQQALFITRLLIIQQRKNQNQWILCVCPLTHYDTHVFKPILTFLLLFFIIQFDRLIYPVGIYKLISTSLEKGTYWFHFLYCEVILEMNLISSLAGRWGQNAYFPNAQVKQKTSW